MPDKRTENADGSTLNRATRNFGRLLRGRGVAAVLELLTVALLARVLSPGPFGNIILMQTYVLILGGLFNFKLYEVVVRYGVPLLETGNHDSFRNLIQLTLFIDFLSSLIAAVVAITAAAVTARILGWDDNMAPVAMLYSTVLLSNGFGTAKGILRIFDRYDVLSVQLMISPVLRLIGVLLVIKLEPSVLYFVLTLASATIIGNGYLIAKGWAEFRRQTGPVKFSRSALRNWQKEFSGLRTFVVILYWQGNVDILPRHLSTLLAGTILGSAAAGLVRLALEATKIISKPGALLRQVLFPDLVRMWVRGAGTFRTIVIRAMLITALLGLVFITASMFGGAALLSSALGEDYAPAAPLMTWFFLATTIELMATVLRGAGYAMGDAGDILRLHLISSALYLILFLVLTPYLGLIGPGVAACLAALIPLGGIGWLVVKGIRKLSADYQ